MPDPHNDATHEQHGEMTRLAARQRTLSQAAREQQLARLAAYHIGVETGQPPHAPRRRRPLGYVTRHVPRQAAFDLHRHPLARQRVVFFWATWCALCMQELPHFDRLYRRHETNGLSVLGVNMRESPAKLAWIADSGLRFPVLLDRTGTAVSAFDVRSLPAAFLLDASGVVRHEYQGVVSTIRIEQEARALGVER